MKGEIIDIKVLLLVLSITIAQFLLEVLVSLLHGFFCAIQLGL